MCLKHRHFSPWWAIQRGTLSISTEKPQPPLRISLLGHLCLIMAFAAKCLVHCAEFCTDLPQEHPGLFEQDVSSPWLCICCFARVPDLWVQWPLSHFRGTRRWLTVCLSGRFYCQRRYGRRYKWHLDNREPWENNCFFLDVGWMLGCTGNHRKSKSWDFSSVPMNAIIQFILPIAPLQCAEAAFLHSPILHQSTACDWVLTGQMKLIQSLVCHIIIWALSWMRSCFCIWLSKERA